MTLIVLLDENLFHFYSHDVYQIMILLSIVPLAANTVSYATELRTQPEKAAVAVLLRAYPKTSILAKRSGTH